MTKSLEIVGRLLRDSAGVCVRACVRALWYVCPREKRACVQPGLGPCNAANTMDLDFSFVVLCADITHC